MHFTTPSLLALLLSTGSSLPTPKDAKFFTPDALDPSVTDLSQHTGRIGVDRVDLNSLRVDPVSVLSQVAESSTQTAPSLTRRGDVLLEPEDGRIGGSHSPIQVDRVEANVDVHRPSPHVVASGMQGKSEPGGEAAEAAEPRVSGEQAEKKEDAAGPEPGSGPNPDYLPKFRADYDAGEWVDHY
ncbi:hypothetical protein CDEST_05997 [Colletotrichum destructivum]|uniref:Uncharacterized protein n=1 Tax=Colletotrichum destructivum TaxID=34406 RepID=A0AAX4IDH3_9PEZI|nr:hypothetical protein CDEST_05997 [Colletotrichum destructivum]